MGKGTMGAPLTRKINYSQGMGAFKGEEERVGKGA